MKKYGMLLIVVLTIGLLAESATAERGRSRGKGRGPVMKHPRQAPEGGLTEDQTAQIDAIREAAKKAMEAAETKEERRAIMQKMREDMRALMKTMRSAEGAHEDGDRRRTRSRRRRGGRDCMSKLNLTEEQKAAIDGIRRRARQATQDSGHPEQRGQMRKRVNSAIMAELTDKQREQLEKCREKGKGRSKPGRRHGDCLRKLDLSEEQQAGIDAIRERAKRAAHDAEDREARSAIMKRAQEAINAKLTEEQLEQLEKCRKKDKGDDKQGRRQRGDCIGKLDLTPEQEAAIAALRERAKRAAEGVDSREERRAIMKRMHEAIKGKLTPEQLEELEKCRKRGKGRDDKPHRGRDCMSKLDLTERQEAAIDELRRNARQAAQETDDPEERKNIRKRLQNAISSKLTEEQREKLEKCRSAMRQGGWGSSRRRREK